MISFLKESLLNNPVLVFFVVLGFGFLVGKINIRGFEFGSVAGVLFVGLLFGHLGYGKESPFQSIGFIMFIFSVGLQAGPKFFSVIRQDGLRYLTLAITISGTGFLVALAMTWLFGFEPGSSAGLLAGGLTSSPTLAAAQEAMRTGLVEPPAGFTADQMITNITTAYAITYIFGLAGLIIIIRLFPKLTGVNLAEEAARLEKKHEEPADILGRIVTRAYRITKKEITGIPLAELYKKGAGLLTIFKLKRDDEFLEIGPKTIFQLDDCISLIGPLEKMKQGPERIGPEVTDADLLDAGTEACQVVITNRKVVGMALSRKQIAEEYGCLLTGIKRLGVEVPVETEIILERGDVISLTGPRASLDRLGDVAGHIEREVVETDLLTFSFGIAIGMIVGTLSVKIAGISVGLGSAGGLLASGLTIGFLRSIHPTFGRMPEAARWVFMEMGLLFFMAGIGLRAGKGIVEALLTSGPTLFLSGVLVTTLPVVAGYLVGRYILRINLVLLLGAITGSMTSGACLSIVNQEAKSSIPALGYTGAYAFANVLLTIGGSIILLW
jgi:putative transport protein